MSRPQYEQPSDLSAQAEVAKLLAQRTSGVLVPTPKLSSFDYRLEKNGVLKGFIEIKCRSNSKNKYSTYMLSMKKVKVAKESGLPVLLAVRWTDAIGILRIDKADYYEDVGGRDDRGDLLDKEKVAHFPIKDFQIIKVDASPAANPR